MKIFKSLEKRSAANSTRQFFVGDKITLADFALFGVIYTGVYNNESQAAPIMRDLWDSHPHLKEYAESLGKIFHDYLETRPKCPR